MNDFLHPILLQVSVKRKLILNWQKLKTIQLPWSKYTSIHGNLQFLIKWLLSFKGRDSSKTTKISMLIFSKAIGKYISSALPRTNYFRFDFLNKSPENSMFICLYDKYYKQEKCYFRSDFKITRLLRCFALIFYFNFQLWLWMWVTSVCNIKKKFADFIIFFRAFQNFTKIKHF